MNDDLTGAQNTTIKQKTEEDEKYSTVIRIIRMDSPKRLNLLSVFWRFCSRCEVDKASNDILQVLFLYEAATVKFLSSLSHSPAKLLCYLSVLQP